MQNKSSAFVCFAALTIVLVCCAAQARTFITIDDPLGAKGSVADGFDGTDVCGTYIDANGISHGFLFDGTNYTTLDDPSAVTSTNQPNNTYFRSISGGTIVGSYTGSDNGTHGFIYSGSTFTTDDDPNGPKGTGIAAVSGSTYVGNYSDSAGYHGFIQTGSTYITIDDPNAPNNTAIDGISGSTIIGYYFKSGRNHGFTYNGATYTTVDDPSSVDDDVFTGMDGTTHIVGAFADASNLYHGFFYDGSTFTTIDDPSGAEGTILYGVNDTTVVGKYTDSNGVVHGFESILPEPSTGSIFAAGLIFCVHPRKRQFSKRSCTNHRHRF